MASFVILTTADLPEAYFLGAFLESHDQPFGLVNIVARPLRDQIRVLTRLSRKRGLACVGDVVVARLVDALLLTVHRKQLRQAVRAFPEVTPNLVRGLRARHPHLECHDPHDEEVLAFVRGLAPDYILLAGAPILRPSFFGLARRATLNRHLGLLPDFRGSDCAVWAFALGRPECAGYSIHVVNERVDGGDVVVRRPLPANGDATLEDYLRHLRREASNAFVGVIGRLLEGAPLRPLAQARSGQYFPPAGWSVQRRAVRNYARLAVRPASQGTTLPTDVDDILPQAR